MTKYEFRNLLCVLNSIDKWELPNDWNIPTRAAFLNDPIEFFLRCDDNRSDAIWEVMLKRTERRNLDYEPVDDTTPF